MLKMYIDGEQVVSNNNFQIKEEILSPSSAILNNVYPLSWEQDKDYTSRFYYPKDYSSFILDNYTHILPEDGSTTTIQNGTIQDVNTSKEQEVTQLLGDTEQETISGNNLLNEENVVNGYYAVDTGNITTDNAYRTAIIDNLPAGSYTFKTDLINPRILRAWYDGGTHNIGLDTNKTSFTTTTNGKVMVCFRNTSSTTITQTLQNQINKGYNVDLPYEQYCGGIPSPNPNYPQDIEVVTGNQVVDVHGKNYFDKNNVTSGYLVSRVNGTLASSSRYSASDYIPMEENTTYTLNGAGTSTESFDRWYSACYDKNKNYIGYVPNQNTFTTLPNTRYMRFSAFSAKLDTALLVKGNTLGEYEPYIGNTYEVNLGKNLFDYETLKAYKSSGLTLIDNGFKTTAYSNFLSKDLKLEKGKTYTLSFDVQKYGTQTQSGASGLIAIRDMTNSRNLGYYSSGASFTIPDNCNETWIYLYGANPSNETEYYEFSNIMIEKGSTQTSYSPYFTPIELCKIGNYQDKIYKSGDTWYLHKEIGKVVLTGGTNETYSFNSGTTQFYMTRTNFENLTPARKSSTNGFSNYFVFSSTNSWILNNISFSGTGALQIWINDSSITSTALFKNWLQTHNTQIFYVLNTPTETEITNEELINQLESIKLIEGYNEVSITSGDLPGSLTIHYNFVTEQHIDEVIFSGMVKNTSDISLNPRMPKYCSLEVLDYKTLLSEGDTLDFVIYNKTILEAINMVVDAISDYGFELGNVNILNGNEIIGTYSTDNKTAYDVLQYLADISGAKWNCRKKDEYSMYIDFYDPTLLPKGKQIEYTTEWACENNLVDLTFNYGTRDYRNKQVILSDEVYADIDYNEDKIADSYTRDFILNNPIGTIKEILVNGERVSVATDTEKDIGVYADFYYKIGDNIVSSNDSNQPYEFGNVISITYIPIIKGREVIQNDNEIDRIANQLAVKGTIARYEDRNDETDTNKLLAIGETYLKYKGEAEITLTLQTKDNDIYDIGQMVYFNAPIEDLAKDYLVKSKEINIIVQDEEPGHIFYTYELSSSFNSERAVNWFDNQRSKTEGNIKEGEYISRNIDISARTEIVWNNCYCEEIEDMTGDNVINAPLDAPIIK